MFPADYVQGTCVHDTCNQSHIPLATFRLHQSEVSSPSPLFLPSLSPLFLYLHSVLLPVSFDPHSFSLSNICIAAFLPHLFISTCIHVYTSTSYAPLPLVLSLSVTYQQPIYPPFSLLFSLHFLSVLCGLYSGTSDKGPSEIGMTSLQRTLVSTPC